MKAFISAIRKEPIASTLGLVAIVFIGWFVYGPRPALDKAPKETVDAVMKVESDLLNWANLLVKEKKIDWTQQPDQNGNLAWFGEIGADKVPEWINTLLGPGRPSASANRSKDAVQVFLLYSSPGWTGVTINLPSGNEKGSVAVSRLHRQ